MVKVLWIRRKEPDTGILERGRGMEGEERGREEEERLENEIRNSSNWSFGDIL